MACKILLSQNLAPGRDPEGPDDKDAAALPASQGRSIAQSCGGQSLKGRHRRQALPSLAGKRHNGRLS
jgi:hypothetical protein